MSKRDVSENGRISGEFGLYAPQLEEKGYLAADLTDPNSPKLVFGEKPFYWQVNLVLDDAGLDDESTSIYCETNSGDRFYIQSGEAAAWQGKVTYAVLSKECTQRLRAQDYGEYMIYIGDPAYSAYGLSVFNPLAAVFGLPNGGWDFIPASKA
jgi:hypothetical protein